MAEVVKADSAGLAKAVAVLKRGGIVAYPTETSYGLGCDATNGRAVRKIFAAKGRVREKSLPIIVSSAAMAAKYLKLDRRSTALAHEFMPGPLSLVVPLRKGSTLAPSLSQTKTISFRISSNSFARSLARRLGKPVVATSANLSGAPAAYSVREVLAALDGKIDLIVDGGTLQKRQASTVIDLSGREPRLLREGILAGKAFRLLRKKSS